MADEEKEKTEEKIPSGAQESPKAAEPTPVESKEPEKAEVVEPPKEEAAAVQPEAPKGAPESKAASTKEVSPRQRGGKGGGRRGPGGGRRNFTRREAESEDGLIEKVVSINRCAKVVKGGRRFSFSALVVVGDGKGKVGYGFGKAKEVAESIRKAVDKAKKNIFDIEIAGSTIPHAALGVHKGGRVLLKPASPGTGIIAGGGVRAIIERAGIRDVLTKSLGSNNAINVVKATVDALLSLRSIETIETLRGVTLPRPKPVASSEASKEKQEKR